VKLSLVWTWRRARTRLDRLTVGRLPAGASVRVLCQGRGCPRPTLIANRRTLRRLQRSLAGTTYRAGDRLFVRISARGYRPQRVKITIRDGHVPALKLL
jgi:hypothetical protein